MLFSLWTALICSFPSTTSIKITNPYEVPVYNDLAYQRYNITISLGTPAQLFPLLLDTGSSDIWVPQSNSSGCSPSCPPGFDPSLSTTITPLNIPYDARYGLTPDLAVLGSYYNDTLSMTNIPSNITNARFAIGNVPYLLFRQGNWGIFGIGSRIQEAVFSGPTSPFRGNRSATYTPVWERLALAASGRRIFSVWLNAQSAKRGSVQFGGEDRGKYHGELANVAVNLQDGERVEWSVNLTSVTRVTPGTEEAVYEEKLLTPANYSLEFTIDTGSPNMYVPTSLYAAITADLNVTEPLNEASYVPCSLRTSHSAGYLDFGFPTTTRKGLFSPQHGIFKEYGHCPASVTIRVPMAEIVYPYGYPVTWPLVPDRNGEKMCYFGIVATDGPIRLLGATFARSAYLVFDGEAEEVGMAQASWDTAA